MRRSSAISGRHSLEAELMFGTPVEEALDICHRDASVERRAGTAEPPWSLRGKSVLTDEFQKEPRVLAMDEIRSSTKVSPQKAGADFRIAVEQTLPKHNVGVHEPRKDLG
jgi:hypothetical protein